MKTISKIYLLLEDKKPRSVRQISQELALDAGIVSDAILRQWNNGNLARSKKRISEIDYQHRGRRGRTRNTRHYYLYTLPENITADFELIPEHLPSKINQAQKIREFILENKDRAFYSREIVEALKDHAIKIHNIMPTIRKMEKKRMCFVRGYHHVERESPFREGFLITFLDSDKPIREAIEEALERTEKRLQDRSSENPLLQRIYRLHDAILSNSHRREITARFYLDNLLDVSRETLDYALKRCLELYPHFKTVRIFNRFLFYYDSTLIDEKQLQAQINLKGNWLRKVAGRYNRLGHNWEAVVGWFVDKFTRDVTFWTQDHIRKAALDPLISKRGMHPRRITLHLIKSVGDRRQNAEVDRVWEVSPTMFAKSPTIYVLEAKWSLVSKKTLDDFFEVLRWSKAFGTDSQRGRVIKSGIVPIFAASSFSNEKIKLGDETLSVAEYAARRNIEIWTQARFNQMLRDRNVPKEITVQKVCRAASNESEVAELLNKIWSDADKAAAILNDYTLKNNELFQIEKEMIVSGKKR